MVFKEMPVNKSEVVSTPRSIGIKEMAVKLGWENKWVLRRYGVFILDIQIILDGDEFILGRGQNSGIPYSVGVSRRHALLKRTDDDKWKIKDLGSMNGLFINSIKVDQNCFEYIKEFDIIGLGVTCGTREDHYSFMLCRKPKYLYENDFVEPLRNNIELHSRKHYGQKMDFIIQEQMPDNNDVTFDCREVNLDNLDKRPSRTEEMQDEDICIILHTNNYKNKPKEVITIDDSDSSDVEIAFVSNKRRRKFGSSTGKNKQASSQIISENASHLLEKGAYFGPIQTEKYASQHDVQSPYAISKEDYIVKVEAVQSDLQNDMMMLERSGVRYKQTNLDVTSRCSSSFYDIGSSNSHQNEYRAVKYIEEENDVDDSCLNEHPQSTLCQMLVRDTVHNFFDPGIDEEELRSRIVWPPKPDSQDCVSSQIPQEFVNVDEEMEKLNYKGTKISFTSPHGTKDENFSEQSSNNDVTDKFHPGYKGSRNAGLPDQISDNGISVHNRKSCCNNNSYSGTDEEQPCNNIILPKADNENKSSQHPCAGAEKRHIANKENGEERNCFPNDEVHLAGKNVKFLENQCESYIKVIDVLPRETIGNLCTKELQIKVKPTKDKIRVMPCSPGGTSAIPEEQGPKRLKGTLCGKDAKCNFLWSKQLADIAMKLPLPNDIPTSGQFKATVRAEAVQRFASRTDLLLQSMLSNEPSCFVKKGLVK